MLKQSNLHIVLLCDCLGLTDCRSFYLFLQTEGYDSSVCCGSCLKLKKKSFKATNRYPIQYNGGLFAYVPKIWEL
jgi:hypothetical protein